MKKGSAHPLTILFSELVSVFNEIGYKVELGPEIETEYYNFDALNIPKNHPARELWDTFWIKGKQGELLRTHTSSVQIRCMEKNNPPIKIIVPGKVFRNEATDATHEAQFHQCEGLCIGENVTLADMKGTIDFILKRLFGDNLVLRYRPSFFPFTEPSLEVDMKRPSDNKWIEIIGCGMVNKNVLSMSGVDSNKFQGFAFGIGIDRIAMLRYGLTDVRDLYTGDLRLVNQFKYEK